MALRSPELLPPQAEVIKDVKETFLTEGGVQLDAWLHSKGNKITNSLPAPHAAAAPSPGVCRAGAASRGVLEVQGQPLNSGSPQGIPMGLAWPWGRCRSMGGVWRVPGFGAGRARERQGWMWRWV